MLIETRMPNQIHRGKVRDTYLVDDNTLLMVATDRISAFDVVLPNGIPNKGRVLNKLSAFWFEKTQHLVPNHLISLADELEAESPLRQSEVLTDLDPVIAQQAMVVKRAERIDIECIVRGYITGSAWSEYRRQGTVSGQKMPVGMLEGQRFPEPLFTPTTKAEEGHDQNMTHEEVLAMVGADSAKQLEEASQLVYKFAHDFARERDIDFAYQTYRLVK